MTDITVVNGELIIAQETINKLHELNKIKKELEKFEKKTKQALVQAMRDNNIKSFENDDIKITYMEPSVRTSLDQKKALEFIESCGLDIEDYERESKVKESVRITYR